MTALFDLAQIADLLRAAVPSDIITMSRWFPSDRQLERVFSTDAATYPVGGRKNKPPTPWSETVLAGRRRHIVRNPIEIALHFDDHELLARRGITSILNVPVTSVGTTIGTVNLMRAGVPFSEADADSAEAIVVKHAEDLAMAFATFRPD